MHLTINILAVIMIVLCVLMTLVILVQEDKSGGGLGVLGGSSQSFFGASSATMLTKITSILLVLFFVLSLIIGSLSAKTTRDAQIGNKLISELEFDTSIVSENTVKKLTKAPENINAEDFETFIISKISDENIKNELKSYYEKEKRGLYYTLTKDAAKNKQARIVEILNDINYSPEAVTTIVE